MAFPTLHSKTIYAALAAARLVFLVAALTGIGRPGPTAFAAELPVALPNAGFEEGLSAPWGTGQYAEGRPPWWNSGGCSSEAKISSQIRKSGVRALHVENRSPRSASVYGTTTRPLTVTAGQAYRITLWARASGLASDGAVSIVTDDEWKVRPIRLPKGTYDWTLFRGEFTPRTSKAQLRILSEDKGEVWLDDFSLAAVGREPEPAPIASPSVSSPAVPPAFGRAVAAFRTQALSDYRQALAGVADEAVIEKFRRLDGALWPRTSPGVGWSYFLNLAVVAQGGDPKTRPLIAFYHPWSDVFLVTVWEEREGRVRLVDADVVMGDCVRMGGRFPDVPIPAWLRSADAKPVALGLSTAESVAAFENLFRGADGRSWRDRLPALKDPDVLTSVNYAGAALLLVNATARVAALTDPTPGESPLLPAVRRAAARMLSECAAGRVGGVLEGAAETRAPTKELLLKTAAQVYTSLTVAGSAVGDGSAVVFFVSPNTADYAVAATLAGNAARMDVRRIDVIPYAFFLTPQARGKRGGSDARPR